jgi:hypothetical protein
MFDHLTNEGMLDRFTHDWAVYRLQHPTWKNRHELWRRFLRTV